MVPGQLVYCPFADTTVVGTWCGPASATSSYVRYGAVLFAVNDQLIADFTDGIYEYTADSLTSSDDEAETEAETEDETEAETDHQMDHQTEAEADHQTDTEWHLHSGEHLGMLTRSQRSVLLYGCAECDPHYDGTCADCVALREMGL